MAVHCPVSQPSSIPARLEQVRGLPVRLRVAALSDALAGCSPDEARVYGPDLIELAVLPRFAPPRFLVAFFRAFPLESWLLAAIRDRCDAALGGVAAGYVSLPTDLRKAALAVGAGRWAAVAPSLATDSRPRVRRSVATLAGDSLDARLAMIAADLLGDPKVETGLAAERSLLLYALSLAGEEAPLEGDPALVEAAVAESLHRFPQHRRRGAILAAMASISRGRHRGKGALGGILARLHPETRSSLATLIGVTKLPYARLRALEWACVPGLERAAERRLARARTPAEHEVVLSASHLALRPARRLALAGIVAKPPARTKDDESPVPSLGTIARLTVPARRGLPRWIGSIGAAAGVREGCLAMLVADPDPVVRHAAARLAGSPADFALDPDERIAATATLRLAGGTGATPRLWRLLGRSQHAGVRSIARAEVARDADSAPAGSHWLRRRALLSDPPGLKERLERDLRSPESSAPALATIRRLRIAHWFLPMLEQLASEAPADEAMARRAASAVAAIGETAESHRAALFLTHGHARVRANAVEALTRLGRRTPAGVLAPSILELKGDPHHRVRANVLAACLGGAMGESEVARAVRELCEMLGDPSASYRLAGAWLVSRSWNPTRRWPALESAVAQAARDPDPRVRRRATHALARIEASLRGTWRESTPALGGAA